LHWLFTRIFRLAAEGFPAASCRASTTRLRMSLHGKFTVFAKAASRWTGNATAFGLAVLVVVAWLVSGPMFGFSDTWQLVINTGTTIITFLMVFLIQNTQNRDTEAMQIKLDELIRATHKAENTLLDLEELDQAELDRLRDRYEDLARQAREHADARRGDAGARKVHRTTSGDAGTGKRPTPR
jgi:low affinity Fe/Cu permease